jgi:hypothetical protein
MSEQIKEEKYKLSVSSARSELKKMTDYYEIEIEEIEDENLRKGIQQGYDRALQAIRKGRLQVKVENGIKIIQTTKKGETIEYREIDGNAKAAMDGHPAEAYYRRAYALLGALSGNGEAAVKNMKGVDLSLAEVLGLLFLAV